MIPKVPIHCNSECTAERQPTHGRIAHFDDKVIILDGVHNESKAMHALTTSSHVPASEGHSYASGTDKEIVREDTPLVSGRKTIVMIVYFGYCNWFHYWMVTNNNGNLITTVLLY